MQRIILSFQAMDLDTVVLARKIPGNEYLIKHDENGLLFQNPEVRVVCGRVRGGEGERLNLNLVFKILQDFLSLAKQVAYDEKCRDRLTLGGKKYISNSHSLSLEKEAYKSVLRTLMK
jgi:hypothetical protein